MDRKEGRFVGRKLLCRCLYTEHRGICTSYEELSNTKKFETFNEHMQMGSNM